MEYTAKELIEILNQQDECDWIEAKGGHESSHSVMETVCSYANEPGLGGGYILLGVAEDKSQLFPHNRIEIINPGYSLKSEELLGEPGSETRNPFIAAVFHETNLAETKGSGIRAMRRLMEKSHLVPPTFESDRSKNQFISRLLLHHFLDERDIQWLHQFEKNNLTDSQKQALIFVREVGAIDNHTYRQMSNLDTIKSSAELRQLKTFDLLQSKGKGKATYYIAGKRLSTPPDALSTPPNALSTPVDDLSTPPNALSTPVVDRLSEGLKERIKALGQRVNDANQLQGIILEICKNEYFKSAEIAKILCKSEGYVKRKFLSPMIASGKLEYLYPEMLNHPEQAYRAKENNS